MRIWSYQNWLRASLTGKHSLFLRTPQPLFPTSHNNSFLHAGLDKRKLFDPRWLSTTHLRDGWQSRNRKSIADLDRRSKSFTVDEEQGERKDEVLLKPPKSERRNASSWIKILDKVVLELSNQPQRRDIVDSVEQKLVCSNLLNILQTASRKDYAGIDLLSYLGFNEKRWDDVLRIFSALLQNVGNLNPSRESDLLPSNLAWPNVTSLEDLCLSPITIESTSYAAKTTFYHPRNLDSYQRYSGINSDHDGTTMNEIWKSLGIIISEASELPDEEVESVMKYVYRVIAQIHKLGLVPDQVYSYVPSNYTSFIQRPPIMHLVSSRILTTLSDAVWRAHQDEVIAQAASSGVSYKDLSHDPPGGRFRLKVRPLGPEIWLEFVLWCCVDGGFTMSGTKIIDHLERKTEKPWYALNWTSLAGSSNKTDTHGHNVDWARVSLRYGGTVGLIEGYSSEKPFAVMERRTISTEAVLALVESLANSVSNGIPGRGNSLRIVQKSIKTLVGFLEPHNLPAGYFEYLAVRLLQTDSFDPDRTPYLVVRWAEAILWFHSLESAEEAPTAAFSLKLDSIMIHSELVPGLFHQALDSFVGFGDIRRGIETFAQIQNLVDLSKLQSIKAFLSIPQNDPGFFSSRTTLPKKDFVLSHGQLSISRLAGFLDFVTDSKLVRLGNWLLYSKDVDGPRIPRSSFGDPCLAPALCRFAAMSGDEPLIHATSEATLSRSILPSIDHLREMANSFMAVSRIKHAQRCLRQLKRAKVAGVDAGNIASIAAAIMSLELQFTGRDGLIFRAKAREAKLLLNEMLEGYYDGVGRQYNNDRRNLTKAQISSVLRILECIPDTALSEIARAWRLRLQPSNTVSLYVEDFNLLLRAIVDTKGSTTAREIWDIFCEDPREKFGPSRAHLLGDIIVPTSPVEAGDVDREMEYGIRTKQDLPNTRHGTVPLLKLDEPYIITLSSDAYNDSKDQPYEREESVIPAPPASDLDFDSRIVPAAPAAATAAAAGQSPPWPPAPSPPPTTPFHPVVAPNLRTLRCIVQAALQERRARHTQGQPAAEQEAVLSWSKQFFRAFGLAPDAIREELQQGQKPVFDVEDGADDDNEDEVGLSWADEKKAYDQARQRLRIRERQEPGVGRAFTSPGLVTRLPKGVVRRVVSEVRDRGVGS